MPITPYPRPQHRIFQNLRATATNAANRNGALAIGVQYLLAINDGRDLPEFAFSSAGAALLYRHLDNGVNAAVSALTHTVALDSVRLFGSDLEASVATTLGFSRDGLETARLRHAGNIAGGTLHADFAGRPVRVGDLFAVSADNAAAGSYLAADSLYYRRVKSLLGKRALSTVANVAAMATNAASNATVGREVVVAPSNYAVVLGEIAITDSSEFFAVGGRFDGKLAEEFTLVCTTAGGNTAAVFSVAATTRNTTTSATSAAGAGATKYVLNLGYGNTTVTLTVTGTVVVGDTIRLRIFPVHAATAATMLAVVAQGAYVGSASTAYVVEVTQGRDNAVGVITGASIRVYDTSGAEPVQTYYSPYASVTMALGTRGLAFTLNSAAAGYPDLVTGDKFVFSVTAPSVSAVEFDGVELSGPAFDPASYTSAGFLSVDVREVFTGELTSANAAGDDAFTVDAGGVSYAAGLGVVTTRTSSAFRSFLGARGTLRVAFRAALKPGLTEGPVRVASTADLVNGLLGELHVENDLAFGAYQMISGTGGSAIRALRVAADDVGSFGAALKKIRGTDVDYALCPLTARLDVASLVAAHCEEMSDPEHMNFRRSYFGTDSPGEYALWDTLAGGTYREATLVGDLVTLSEEFRAASNFLTAPVRVGDLINFLSLGSSLAVTELVSAHEVRVAGAPGAGVAVAAAFQLVKPVSADNTIDYVSNRSRTVSSRRAVNVWCDQPTALINGVTTLIPMKFVAAEVAGLRSALRPQQGLTMTEVASVTDAPAMFARFTPEQLDTCASNGVMIVTQEIEGGEIFIRHQLTTETAKGALQYEDNPGVVVDVFSYRIKDKFRGYLGKKNVTQATLAAIYTDLKQLAIDATQTTQLENDDIGPMLLSFVDEQGREGEVTVRVDGDLADKIMTYVRLRVPLPLNGLNQYVEAEAALSL